MDQLKRLRTEKGLSQAKLAALADIDPSTVNQIERGAREASPASLRKLAQALDVSLAELLEGADPKAPRRSSLEPSLFNGLEEERHYEKYEDVLKALGFGQEQIEAWKAQDARNKEFSERELERERRRIEKLSPKELREELMARSLAEKRLRRYYREESTTRERSEEQQDKSA
jgi:transcriptional regulator with XRE-family HTH domain